MSTAPRNLPRYLPTLTEVVHPSGLARTAVPATPDLEDTVWFVMQRVDLVLERRLSEEADATLLTVVTEQMQILTARLRQELEIVVRQAVAEAMTSQSSPHKSK
jgi:hypothetical protein